jgi:hypothetical protein
MRSTRILLPIFLMALLFSCKQGNEAEAKEKIVATAGEEKLGLSEFKDLYFNTGTIKDSTYYSKKTIEQWATESLFYQEAVKKLDEEEMQVEKQVETYRRELINYIYQSRLIEANLDTVISPDEIEAYYNEHNDNFILKENIVKVDYIKVPLKAPGIDKIKRILLGVKKDNEQLKNLCVQNAESFFLNDSTWLYLDEIKKEIPSLREQPDFSMVNGRVLQFNDDSYYYYLKIKDVKVKNGLSPLNFERQNIKKFILNNRKTVLVNRYKQLLFEKAKASKSFKIN